MSTLPIRGSTPLRISASVQHSDAATLDFDSSSFDTVMSLLMLHHVGQWRKALVECSRVLRPGGAVIGYDLTRAGPAAWLHRRGGRTGRALVGVEELRSALVDVGFVSVRVDTGLGGLIARFHAHTN